MQSVRAVLMVAVGFVFGFAAVAIAALAIAAAWVGLAIAWIELSRAANVVFRFEPRPLLLAAPPLAVLALGIALVAALVYRRL